MNDQMHTEPHDGPSDRRDVLIGRIIDGEATGQDWAEFRQLVGQLAGDDQSVFAEIAELQDLRRRTMDIVEQAGDLADTVSLPAHMHPRVSPARRLHIAGVWGGWAMAAMVALAWSVGLRPGDPVLFSDSNGSRAGLGTGTLGSAGEALQTYLDLGKQSGSVIGELPSGIVLDKQPTADGLGYEVLYIRPIVERVIVRDVYQQIKTESGQVRIVPAPIAPATQTTPTPTPASASPRPLAW